MLKGAGHGRGQHGPVGATHGMEGHGGKDSRRRDRTSLRLRLLLVWLHLVRWGRTQKGRRHRAGGGRALLQDTPFRDRPRTLPRTPSRFRRPAKRLSSLLALFNLRVFFSLAPPATAADQRGGPSRATLLLEDADDDEEAKGRNTAASFFATVDRKKTRRNASGS